MANGPDHTQGDVREKVQEKTRKPRLFKVILHNDDYTTMDFVVGVLQVVFHKSTPEAVRIMLEVHRRGRGICGVYPHEIAETKVHRVQVLAEQNEFPLQATLEEA